MYMLKALRGVELNAIIIRIGNFERRIKSMYIRKIRNLLLLMVIIGALCGCKSVEDDSNSMGFKSEEDRKTVSVTEQPEKTKEPIETVSSNESKSSDKQLELASTPFTEEPKATAKPSERDEDDGEEKKSEEELLKIATAYAEQIEYLWDPKFELYDVTEDGIPEIIGAGGCMIYTYTPWNECAECIWDEMVIYDLYYDEEERCLLANTFDGNGNSLLFKTVFTIDKDSTNAFSWAQTELVEDEMRLNQVTLIVDGWSCCAGGTDRTFASGVARYNRDEATVEYIFEALKKHYEME